MIAGSRGQAAEGRQQRTEDSVLNSEGGMRKLEKGKKSKY
ncbi:hypothetical protein D1BOALGB6SA_10037 [Olavius sp. associated proteobacterium Delta 1]|nr:hypothetical protein D1BOALGB6SA_10037 [Olavius sp. associated proteobacterium Delta 1]